MANWTDSVKIDRLWKALFGRSRGDSSAQFFEECVPSTLDVHASDVYADPIPLTPPSASTSVIRKLYPIDESGEGWLTLTRDRKYNGGRVWVALQTWNANWSSGSGDVSQILKNFVGPRYGNKYAVKVYDGSDQQISELDGSSWLFDYRAGVLTFETDRAESGISQEDSVRLKVYQYVGTFVSTSGGSGDVSVRSVEQFEAEPGQTTVQLIGAPRHGSLLDVYVNGIGQFEGIDNDYVLSGSSLLFNYALSNELTDVVTVKYW